MNIQERIKALEEKINKKLKALKAKAHREQEFPQEGDKYWYINPLGIVLRDEWLGFVSERYMIEIGNVFKTEQDAHFAVEKLKVEAELRKFSRPFESMASNFYMILDTSDGSIDTRCMVFGNVQGAIYFESKEKAKRAIESVGEERIKKYIFGVED